MADIDLKTATPDTTLPTTGFLFGADSQAAASPSVFTVQSVATTLLGSTTLTGATVTTSSPVIDAAQTWNDGGTTFTGLKFNATDTASAAASLLMDFQVGGSSAFNVSKGGSLKLGRNASGTNVAGSNVTIAGSQGTGTGAGGSIVFQVAPAGSSGTAQNALATVLQLNGTGGITGQDGATANTIAQRNGTNAQAFRVYNTYTSATEFERGNIYWDSNVLKIGTEKGSAGGTARALEFQTDGVTYYRINTSGTPRHNFSGGNVDFTGNIVAGGDITIAGADPFTWSLRSKMTSPSNGVIRFSNNAVSDFDRLQFGGTTSSFPALKRVSANLQVIAADNAGSAGLIVGNQALTTTATDGFLYVPTCAGTPTGTPTTQTGTVPIVVDTTNNKLYFYSGAAWRDAGP